MKPLLVVLLCVGVVFSAFDSVSLEPNYEADECECTNEVCGCCANIYLPDPIEQDYVACMDISYLPKTLVKDFSKETTYKLFSHWHLLFH
jgi:hypothetical protein